MTNRIISKPKAINRKKLGAFVLPIIRLVKSPTDVISGTFYLGDHVS